MEARSKRVTVAAVLFCLATAAFPCSDPWQDSFHLMLRPDAPIEKYVSGRLGIVLPTFAQSYLVIAYRYFSGHPLTVGEDAAAAALINRRLNRARPDDETAVDKWLQARSRVPGAQPVASKIEPASEIGYQSYINCTSDAFYTAIQTLNQRIDEFGLSNPAVLDWVTAQDAVFGNCAGSAAVSPAAASLPAVFRADRDYQIAAAAFYGKHYDDAHARFAAIATDSSSPWRTIAPYVAARALIRKATLTGAADAGGFDRVPLQAAGRELDAILADPARRDLHGRASALRGFVEFRLNPEQRTAELARNLSNAMTAQDLSDYTDLLGDQPARDDMTDWIQTFHRAGDDRRQNGDAKSHALARWRETRSLSWLVAAITMAAAGDADAHELIAAAQRVSTDSPARVTLAYHAARLLIASNDFDGARSLLDGVIAHGLAVSPRNLLLELRLPLARNIAEFARDAVQSLAGDEYDYERPFPAYERRGFSEDAAQIINTRMPLSTMIELSQSSPYDTVLAPLRYAVWTRAALLGRHDIAVAHAPAVEWKDAGLKSALARYARATEGQRDREALWLILNCPELEPYVESGMARSRNRSTPPDEVDHVLRNWWCIDGATIWDYEGDGRSEVESPLFLRSVAAEAEVDRGLLQKAGSGATYILSGALDWARSKPDEPRVPEALGRAVLGTRWACGDGRTHALSKSAWELLHSKYRTTQWAQKTKYWYVPGLR